MNKITCKWGPTKSLTGAEREMVETSCARRVADMTNRQDQGGLTALRAIDAAIVKGMAIIKQQQKEFWAAWKHATGMGTGHAGTINKVDPIYRAWQKNAVELSKLKMRRAAIVAGLSRDKRFTADIQVAPFNDSAKINIELTRLRTRHK